MSRQITKGVTTEADLLEAVLSLAKLFGWRTFHQRAGMNRNGVWSSATKGDGKGWPDLICVRERVIVAELKSATGTVTPEQRQWLNAFEGAGCSAYVIRPADLAGFAEVLRRRVEPESVHADTEGLRETPTVADARFGLASLPGADGA